MTEAGTTRGKRTRKLFTKDDPFRGADLALARRFSKAGWIIGAVVGIGLSPFYPPTARIGAAGWAIAGGDALITSLWIVYLYKFEERVTFNTLLFTAYLGIWNVLAAQWLAGGLPAAYHELYPFMIIAAAAVHPPRRFVVFMVVMTTAAIVPEALGNASARELGDLITELLLWLGASMLIVAVMWKLRNDRAEREERHDEAQELARVDTLTRLGNRRAFEEAVTAEISRARRTEAPLSLLVCDLNSFKKINDVYGHLAGDDCLRQVAAALRDELRGGDFCFRWGGDEFIVLLPDADDVAASEVSVRLEELVAGSCARPDESALTITSGQATLLDWMSADDLVAEADRALLARKSSVSAERAS